MGTQGVAGEFLIAAPHFFEDDDFVGEGEGGAVEASALLLGKDFVH